MFLKLFWLLNFTKFQDAGCQKWLFLPCTDQGLLKQLTELEVLKQAQLLVKGR